MALTRSAVASKCFCRVCSLFPSALANSAIPSQKWMKSAEEEGLTPEIERALTVYLEGAAEKRDRVADFIHFCEGMAELAKAEGKRLQVRQKHFEATAERVSAMVDRKS